MVSIRFASQEDLESILEIYNHGIEDRVATLEQTYRESTLCGLSSLC